MIEEMCIIASAICASLRSIILLRLHIVNVHDSLKQMLVCSYIFR